jgi:hypothetical protein
MSTSFTWICFVAWSGMLVFRSPVAVSATWYDPRGRLMLGSSPLKGVVWPMESMTVQEKVVVGSIPIECEASSSTPNPPGGFT